MMFALFVPTYRGEVINFEPTVAIEALTPDEALQIAKDAGHRAPIVGPLPESWIRQWAAEQ